MKTKFFVLCIVFGAINFLSCQSNRVADTLTVKVAVVYEDPILPSTNARIHESCTTPHYDFKWNNPREQTQMFIEAINESSHGVVKFEIVEVIEADTLFTKLKDSSKEGHLTISELDNLLHLDTWGPAIERNLMYDYASMVEYYGFDKKCDAGVIDEVWIYSSPLSGAYESHLMGKDAFWLNSPGETNCTCNELLTVMFFNYERDLACALESFSHRFESTMMKIYGWWDYENRKTIEELTTWDKYTAYEKIYDAYDKGKSNVGNVHFPPNGIHDYDFMNKDYVLSYADEWYDYPEVPQKSAKLINCDEWGSHEGYMRWWLSHMPHFKGISPYDGKLNNWWHYVVDYDKAIQLENRKTK